MAAIRTAADIDFDAKFMGLRHGGSTESGNADLTDAQIRALSGHNTAAITALYPSRTLDAIVQLCRDNEFDPVGPPQKSPATSIVLRRVLWAAAYFEQEAREESDPWDEILSQTVGTVGQDEERVFSRDLVLTVLGITQASNAILTPNVSEQVLARLAYIGQDGHNVGKGYIPS